MSERLLKEKGVGTLLVTLLENPDISQKELENLSGLSNFKVLRIVPRLIDHELVTERTEMYNRKILNLTQAGKEAAIKFKDLYSMFKPDEVD